MTDFCDCSNLTLGDIGKPTCDVKWKVLSGQIFMFTVDSDGNRNKFDASDLTGGVFTQAALQAKIDEPDPTKRWYVTGQIYTVEGERAESTKFEASNGDLFNLSPGARNRKFEVLDQGPALMEEYEKFGCPQISVFDVDKTGNMRGIYDGTDLDTLYPIRVQKGSVEVLLFDETVDKAGGFSMAFNFDSREMDSKLRMINKANITADLLTDTGLIGVTATYGNITATTVEITLVTKYGDFLDPIPMTGLVTADFYDSVGGTASSILNETTPGVVAVTASETSDGVYLLTFAAQTAADVMSCAPLKTGFNFATVPAVKFAAV